MELTQRMGLDPHKTIKDNIWERKNKCYLLIVTFYLYLKNFSGGESIIKNSFYLSIIAITFYYSNQEYAQSFSRFLL